MESVPLAVDLDGTLIRTDSLQESLLGLLHHAPLDLLRLPSWLAAGRAHFKAEVARRGRLNVELLPLNDELVVWLREQKLEGRRLILATGADAIIADRIASRVGLFDEILSSDGITNLTGDRKASALEQRFGKKGFDYVANSRKDLAVWRHARKAIVVNASGRVARHCGEVCDVVQEFRPPSRGPRTWLRMLRVHQWLKNILLFTPIAAAHQLTNPGKLSQVAIAFAAFSIGASAVYLANDLLDLESDRRHPRKRRRAFASGHISLRIGIFLMPVLLALGIALAQIVGTTFLQWLLVYIVITFGYSFGLKRLAIIDALVLAMLYTLRVIAGAAATDTPLSFWLLAFSIFFFLSLAFVKRFAELQAELAEGGEKAHGRGYSTADAPIVQLLGVSAGFSAVLILALYLNTTTVHDLYKSPQLVWGAIPVMLYWVSWIWLKAHRGEMHDDPVIFAIREKTSLLAGALVAAILIVGTVGWPW